MTGCGISTAARHLVATATVATSTDQITGPQMRSLLCRVLGKAIWSCSMGKQSTTPHNRKQVERTPFGAN
jgi:hypothetical protein